MRFYPRYDTEPSAIDEALSILRAALEDSTAESGPARGPGAPREGATAPAPKIRVGTLEIPLDTSRRSIHARELRDLQAADPGGRAGALRRGCRIPPDVLALGGRPLLQFPLETLEATMANPRAIGVALRDRVSGRIVGYALGSALENHDEEGVSSDPHFGENNTFYLQAMATLPTVQNDVEIENHLLDALRERALAAGFEFLSTLIEERVRAAPAGSGAAVLERIENYLRSGIAFAYLQAPITDQQAPPR